MLDQNKHKLFIVQILKDIYHDLELANNLGFKGGTALMLFYDLPRFSVDLDFNLLDISKTNLIYEKIKKIFWPKFENKVKSLKYKNKLIYDAYLYKIVNEYISGNKFMLNYLIEKMMSKSKIKKTISNLKKII